MHASAGVCSARTCCLAIRNAFSVSRSLTEGNRAVLARVRGVQVWSPLEDRGRLYVVAKLPASSL